jgi:hypothetical protein
LHAVLYGRETWSPTLREEQRLKVFEYRVLMRIFGPKKDEIIGWRQVHNEEFHNLYSSQGIIIRMSNSRTIRWAGHVERMERRGMHVGMWWEIQKDRDHTQT